jgi:hypothetical protein
MFPYTSWYYFHKSSRGAGDAEVPTGVPGAEDLDLVAQDQALCPMKKLIP